MSERRSGDRRRNGRDCLMTEAEVAVMAGVSPLTVKYWRRVGTLPFVRVGRHPRVWLSECLKFLRAPGNMGAPMVDIRRDSNVKA